MSSKKPDFEIDFFGPCDPLPPLRIYIQQYLRKLLKDTLWDTLTTLPKHIGLPVQTVQVLVVDRKREMILLLYTEESKTGYFPIQGLRKRIQWIPPQLGYQVDPREDAQRELEEEALTKAPELSRFLFQHRYREGINSQFDCRVYVVDGDSRQLGLKDEDSEGLPLWKNIDEAKKVLNQTLVGILERLPPYGDEIPTYQDTTMAFKSRPQYENRFGGLPLTPDVCPAY